MKKNLKNEIIKLVDMIDKRFNNQLNNIVSIKDLMSLTNIKGELDKLICPEIEITFKIKNLLINVYDKLHIKEFKLLDKITDSYIKIIYTHYWDLFLTDEKFLYSFKNRNMYFIKSTYKILSRSDKGSENDMNLFYYFFYTRVFIESNLTEKTIIMYENVLNDDFVMEDFINELENSKNSESNLFQLRKNFKMYLKIEKFKKRYYLSHIEYVI